MTFFWKLPWRGPDKGGQLFHRGGLCVCRDCQSGSCIWACHAIDEYCSKGQKQHDMRPAIPPIGCVFVRVAKKPAAAPSQTSKQTALTLASLVCDGHDLALISDGSRIAKWHLCNTAVILYLPYTVVVGFILGNCCPLSCESSF